MSTGTQKSKDRLYRYRATCTDPDDVDTDDVDTDDDGEIEITSLRQGAQQHEMWIKCDHCDAIAHWTDEREPINPWAGTWEDEDADSESESEDDSDTDTNEDEADDPDAAARGVKGGSD